MGASRLKTNRSLAADYIGRARVRLKAVEVLLTEKSWADVVRESQEVIELALKGLLRAAGVDPPRVPDVSDVLLQNRASLPAALQSDLERLAEASRTLRRDRELAFYGAEDLTPSTFYRQEDARAALDSARFVVQRIAPVLLDC